MECDKGLYLYSNVLKNETINIGKIKFVDTKGTGEFLFRKQIIIPQLLQWFIDNGGAKKFSHIVIKSGDFSTRSRSYVSTDGNWHLTHQYYGGGSSVPDMIQAQRLLHDRPDSIPLIEYAPSKVIDNIVKGDMMQDEQIERLIDLRIIGNIEVLCHIQLGEEIWNKEKVPKASLCCGNVNKGFKIQKENRVEGEDGGWDFEMYKEILVNIEPMVNVAMTDSDSDNTLGKYIIIEQNKFKYGTTVYQMISDIELCIIDNNKIGEKIPIDWINKELQKKKEWQNKSLDNIRGVIWTRLRKNKNLVRTNEEKPKSLIYWNEGFTPYVKLTM
jgi:hypothetical protein